MLKSISFITTLFLSQFVLGQITTTKVAVNNSKAATNTKPYDSLKNYLDKDVNQYIGQTLYLKKIPKGRRGMENFMLDRNKKFYDNSNRQYLCIVDQNSLKQYNSIKNLLSAEQFKKTNLTVKCNTNFEAIENKYFKVFGVWPHPKDENYSYKERYYLGLIRKDNNDTCYYVYESSSPLYKFPFLVTGYFEKNKAKFLNKQFVVKGKSFLPLLLNSRFKDIETGQPISLIPGEDWKCVDFTLNDATEETILVVRNQGGKKMAVRFSEDFLENDVDEIFLAKAEADKIKSKYGVSVWKSMLAGDVFIGWTKDMCRLSWGAPNDINKTVSNNGSSEQWVYSGNYLYFKANKLTAIQ